ncbi:acetoacetate decarboxylase [Gammaproteobacteria bacterium 53_120_T64]|nr:acetoacetate decarboxylase [Gammaproteobacteria bacterium 53_120_T64]
MNDRPDFIYAGGSPIMHTPLQLKKANMYGFFLKGKLPVLQKTIDETLNMVAAGKLKLKVLSPYVLTTFTRVGHANSTVAVDKDKGWITEVDIVTWVIVGQLDDDGDIAHVYSYPCHIFVDSGMAMINGRELYGYPKYLCEYQIPELGADPLHFSVNAQGFKTFSVESEMALHPLLEVNASKKNNPHRPIKNFIDFLEQAFEVLRSMPDFLDLDAAAWQEVISMLMKPHIPQIFLKQFPDSAGVKAVYQALITAPANVDKVHSGSILGYEYEATVHNFDSFPLDKTLGLDIGVSPAIMPYNLYFDFTVTAGEELVDNSQVQREKIAILGGGVSAMTSAYYLTNEEGWENKYDITVYQMAWRLGGKGASGRNAEYGERIEEHGLHIWFGFYENAFAMMKEAYTALDRPSDAPLATWQEAFKPHDFIALSEHINQEWRTWPIMFPTLPGEPGDGSESITLWNIAVAAWGWIKKLLADFHDLREQSVPALKISESDKHLSWFKRLAEEVKENFDELGDDISSAIDTLHTLIHNMSGVFTDHSSLQRSLLKQGLQTIKESIERDIDAELDSHDELRRLFITIDLGLAVLTGMLEDDVFEQGFDVINDIDFYAWLEKHGANPKYSVHSAPIRGFYDLVFAYEGGDFNKPNVEAGTILRAMMRIGVCYKGSVMYKMQAGMGDTVFTPIYEVLKERGVKFKFFHKVDELIPQGDSIEEIHLTQQVSVVDGSELYDPLIDVKGLGCWPSTPLYGQIDPQQAALLQAENVNLESNWSNWPELYQAEFGQPLPALTLKKGRDFDRIVFGISVASIPQICPQLLAQSPALQTTCKEVKTVVTQAYQVWMNKDLAELGWSDLPEGQEPVLSGFSEPYDTWAPMDQLLCREDWPAGEQPQNVSYFCSAMPVDNFPPITDHEFPARCKQQAKENALEQLDQRITALWPYAGSAGDFKWQWLLDPDGGSGKARFDSQFWRANIDPSEHYVMSVVNSSQHRIATDGSGFNNLFMTGDWIKTGLNAGCVEAAVMAGMQCSRAMIGYPKIIKGETDF